MDNVVNYGIPLLVILIMMVVGAEVTLTNLRHALHNPLLLIKVSISQIFFLSITCLLINYIFSPKASLISGMVLIVACPGGALSNYYTYLAKGDVAFSVSLTVVSTLLSFLTLPLLVEAGFSLLLDTSLMIEVPVTQLMSQLFFLLLIPVCCGVLVRYLFNNWCLRSQLVFQRITLVALLALIMFISWEQADFLWQQIYSIVYMAIAFNIILLLAGFWLSRLIVVTKAQSLALLFELPVRNLGIAAIAGATLLGHTEIVVFSAAFIVIQLPIMLVVVATVRKFESHIWAT